VKVGLCLFLICFQGSDEDGTEIGARGRCGGESLRHGNTIVTGRNSDETFGSRELVWGKRSKSVKSAPHTVRQVRHCLVGAHR
jgi:hypothetical protein